MFVEWLKTEGWLSWLSGKEEKYQELLEAGVSGRRGGKHCGSFGERSRDTIGSCVILTHARLCTSKKVPTGLSSKQSTLASPFGGLITSLNWTCYLVVDRKPILPFSQAPTLEPFLTLPFLSPTPPNTVGKKIASSSTLSLDSRMQALLPLIFHCSGVFSEI